MRIAQSKAYKALLMLVLIALAAFSTASTTKTVAAKPSMTFTYILGQGPLCALGPKACPDISMAPNGDMIWINGTGTLSTSPKSVTGGGTFTHKHADGTLIASGTWMATDLVMFVSYGNGVPQGLPDTFFGGRAIIKVTIFVGSTAVHTALLQITCLLGNPPSGAHEGLRLNVQDAINFNKSVSGDTVFILAP